jgi:HlyD family secretion protein
MDRTIENKNWIPKKYRLFLWIGILALVLGSLSLLVDTSSAYHVDSSTITVAEVSAAPFQDYINVRGRVEPSYMAYLDAVEGGIVESISKDEGLMVKQGDTLLLLSNLNLSLNILNSEAQLAEKANFLRETQISMEQQKLSLQRELLRLEFDLKQTKRKYHQSQSLYTEQLISKDDFLASEEVYDLAVKLRQLSLKRQRQDSIFRKTQIQKINQNLQNMERNLALIYQRQDHLVVRAPVDGQLATLNAVPGQAIMPGYRIGQVNVLTDYKLQASIDEHYIDRVHTNLSASLKRQEETYPLILSKIYPEVNEGQFLVDLIFEDAIPAKIRSGQSYNLNIQLGDTREAVLLPRGAFFQSTGGRWVYVLSTDGQSAIKRPIHIGRQNPKYYEVLEGLQAGDRVVISSYALFGDNEQLFLN